MSQESKNELSIYIKQIKSFQDSFFEYFEDNKISESKQKFITTLCFISKVSKKYHRSSDFISKIKQILLYFQPFYNQYLTNIELFNLFKKNKLILLLLFKEKILLPDARSKLSTIFL